MLVKVCIQRTELNRCVNVVVQKTFLWRTWKDIFQAINRLIRISGNLASKPQEKCLFQKAPLCVR